MHGTIQPNDKPGHDDMKISFQQLSPTFNDTKTNLNIWTRINEYIYSLFILCNILWTILGVRARENDKWYTTKKTRVRTQQTPAKF